MSVRFHSSPFVFCPRTTEMQITDFLLRSQKAGWLVYISSHSQSVLVYLGLNFFRIGLCGAVLRNYCQLWIGLGRNTSYCSIQDTYPKRRQIQTRGQCISAACWLLYRPRSDALCLQEIMTCRKYDSKMMLIRFIQSTSL